MVTERGLGNDPLTARARRLPSVIPSAEQAAAPPPAPTPADARPAGRSSKVVGKDKTQVTGYIHTTVVEDARNAVVATMSNPAAHRNLSQLIEAAVVAEVARMRQQFHDDEPFPARRVELQPGRPGGN